MTRLLLCLALHLALVLGAAAHAADDAPAPGKAAYAFTDLTGDFTRFFDQTAAFSEKDRVAAFKQQVVPLFPEFYGSARFPKMTPERFDARIAKALAGFPAMRERYVQKAAGFQAMLDPALNRFRQTFPDMQAMPPVYLLHSMGEMDGGTRELGGKVLLIFGADAMVGAHDFSDEQPFLDHELFHVYHQGYFPECNFVWCGLWLEGMAVYAAQQMNPTASDSQLLLTKPEPLRAEVDAHLKDAVCDTRALLSSSNNADIEALFSFSRLNPNVPPRAGYYIGYLAARQAGKTRSLTELAHLSPAQVRPVLEEALKALASCK